MFGDGGLAVPPSGFSLAIASGGGGLLGGSRLYSRALLHTVASSAPSLPELPGIPQSSSVEFATYIPSVSPPLIGSITSSLST